MQPSYTVQLNSIITPSDRRAKEMVYSIELRKDCIHVSCPKNFGLPFCRNGISLSREDFAKHERVVLVVDEYIDEFNFTYLCAGLIDLVKKRENTFAVYIMIENSKNGPSIAEEWIRMFVANLPSEVKVENRTLILD